MATVLFVSETYIRSNTVFNKNVDTNDIANNVGVSQDMYIEPILGTTFYDALQLSYSAQTLTNDEITLMTYIKPVVAWRAAQLTLPFLTFNVKNKGPQTQNGDFSEPVDTNIMFYLKKEVENRAEWYTQRLATYLCQNANLYPLYTSPGTTNIQPTHQGAYDSGFATYNNFCGYNNLINFWSLNNLN